MPTITEKPSILVVAIGNAGYNFMHQILRNETTHQHQYVFLNRKADTLLAPDASCYLYDETPSEASIRSLLAEKAKGASMMLLLAGLGGEAGSSLSPVVASFARDNGIPLLSAVTVPFAWEGKTRNEVAQKIKSQLAEVSDGLITIDNQAPLSSEIRTLTDWMHAKEASLFAFLSDWERFSSQNPQADKEVMTSFLSSWANTSR